MLKAILFNITIKSNCTNHAKWNKKQSLYFQLDTKKANPHGLAFYLCISQIHLFIVNLAKNNLAIKHLSAQEFYLTPAGQLQYQHQVCEHFH